MKIIFVPARIKEEVCVSLIDREKIPERIGVIGTVQHEHQFEKVKEYLEEIGKKVVIGGTILGCDVSNAERIADKVDAFLYVGSGRFHPIGVALKTGKKLFILNPVSKEFYELKEEDVEEFKKRRFVAVKRFLSSDVVGIITSIKPGQCMIEKAEEIKEKVEEMGKKAYLFIGDEVSETEKENFPFVACWINCACPRLVDFRKDMINFEDLEIFNR